MRLTPFVTAAAAALMFAASAHASWDLWDKMKAVGMEDARVVDYSDSRSITTSEGQSYALFLRSLPVTATPLKNGEVDAGQSRGRQA